MTAPLCLTLLSGWGVDARIWQSLAPFWPENVNVRAVDWPGYCHTPPLSSHTLADLACAMAEPLQTQSVWVGWSLGGLLATALTAYLPEPQGIILLGAGERFCADDGVTDNELKAFIRAFERKPYSTWRHFLRWQTQGEPDPRLAYRMLSDLLVKPAADTATLSAGLNWLAKIDNRKRLASLSCPVIQLVGDADPLVGTPQRLKSQVLADAGHCPMLSQPALLAAALIQQAAACQQTVTWLFSQRRGYGYYG
ncbi:alpha/beta fold hydrolase [Halomonas halocynthiae]|uniref:alpha/beta fold hydrolase n=1 Tax=Halomonas halocynthiae TaxID=176290 RepID=UPI00041C7AA3|nr:alpha/beta fold hydrolase [Halomonas halocynthiae]